MIPTNGPRNTNFHKVFLLLSVLLQNSLAFQRSDVFQWDAARSDDPERASGGHGEMENGARGVITNFA